MYRINYVGVECGMRYTEPSEHNHLFLSQVGCMGAQPFNSVLSQKLALRQRFDPVLSQIPV